MKPRPWFSPYDVADRGPRTMTPEPAAATVTYKVANAILDRYRAGERLGDLARDYVLPLWTIRLICWGRR